MTLHQLIDLYESSGCDNAWVQHPGLNDLYVSISPKNIDNNIYNVISISNISEKNPGQGALTKCIQYILDNFPNYGIYIDYARTGNFALELQRMQFRVLNSGREYFLFSDRG